MLKILAFLNAELKIPYKQLLIFLRFMNPFFEKKEVIKQLFRIHSQRCTFQQIYKGTFLLLCPNNFLFLTLYFREPYRSMYKKLNTFSSAYFRRRAEIRRAENISPRLGSAWHATVLDEENIAVLKLL